MPGILSGVILATGRIVGETAALIFTAGTAAKVPSRVFSHQQEHLQFTCIQSFKRRSAYRPGICYSCSIYLLLVIDNQFSFKMARSLFKQR